MDNNLKSERVSDIINALIATARGDYSSQLHLSPANDEIDSIIMGLNIVFDDLRQKSEEEQKKISQLEHLNSSLNREIVLRKKRESELKKAEMKYQDLFESIADPIFIFEQKSHHFLDCNLAAVQRYGYTREELLTMTPVDLHPQAEQKLIQNKIVNTVNHEPHEYTHLAKDGKRYNVEIHTNQVEYEDKKAWISTVRDITEQKKLSIELDNSYAQLEKRVKARTKMLIEKTEDLTLINHLNYLGNRRAEFNDIIHEAVLGTRRLFHNDGIMIFLISDDGKFLDMTGYDETYSKNKILIKLLGLKIQHLRIPLESDHIYNWVLKQKEPYIFDSQEALLEDFLNYAEFPGRQVLKPFPGMIKKISKALFYHMSVAVPLVSESGNIGLIDMASPGKISDNQIQRMKIIAEQLASLISWKKAEIEITNSQKQLRQLAVKLQKIREDERKRLAGELHDELGHLLTVMKIDLVTLSHQCEDKDPSLMPTLNAIIDLTSKSLDSVKKITTQIRPGVLDKLGLNSAIDWQLNEFQSRTKIHCSFKPSIESIQMTPDQKTTLFRITQESLTNIGRHSKATEVRITLEKKKDSLELMISDNGIGIDMVNIDQMKSLGLLGIRERAHSIGGTAVFHGIKNKGTTVKVTVPLNSEL